jgi:hypothetical protein
MKLFDDILSYRADFPDVFSVIDEWQNDAKLRRDRLSSEGAPLSIGVMGQIKAGKSSFLNQMLFAGRELLPEAATPKTANLTRLRHDRKPRFIAHFYTAEEWSSLERQSAAQSGDLATQAARELVEAASAAHPDIQAVLARNQAVIEVETDHELLGRINEYVGSDGRYTPLVKSSELWLSLPGLEGIEIVDTPGMNDPVVSRTDKTREYMAQCDVVFFLTRASQFFDETDQQLLARQLPGKGVKRLVLVAAQFDGALLDDGYDRASLAESETRLRGKLSRLARTHLERLADQREKTGYTQVAAMLRAIDMPLFASTYAQAFATLPPDHWKSGQTHVFEEFRLMAESCWNNTQPNVDDWRRISGFAALESALNAARADKEAILSSQRTSLEAELARGLAGILGSLRERATHRRMLLKDKDLAGLNDYAQRAQRQVHAIATALTVYLKTQTELAHARARELESDLQDTARRARDVQERTGHETRSRSVKVSGSVWYKPWTWLDDDRHETYYETATYRYVAASDALENLRHYLTNTRRQLIAAFDDVISPEHLSIGMRRALVGALDSGQTGYDAKSLRALIEGAITNLQLPSIEFDSPDPSRELAGFSGEITSSSEMHALRAKLASVVDSVNRTLSNRIDGAVNGVCAELDRISDNLQSKLTCSLASEIERLRNAMADKERELQRIQVLLDEIDCLTGESTKS